MKKLFISGLFIVYSLLTFAQEREGLPVHKGGKGLLKELSLSDNQKKQMKEIRDEKRKNLESLNKEDDILMKDYRLRKAAIQKDAKAKFQAILTTEQKQKLDNIKKGRKEKSAAMSKERLEHMKTDLSLTDNQYKNINKLHDNAAAKMKAVRENETLTIEQKKQEMKEIRGNNRKEMLALLDETQAAKWKELKKQDREKRNKGHK